VHSRLLLAGGAAICFAAGLALARSVAPAPPRPELPGPLILVDSASVHLLPDASLRLDRLPKGFDTPFADAGAP